jgi:hypothetical protein
MIFNVAASDALDVGLNTTLMVQVDPAGTRLAQVFVCENALVLVPVIVTPPISNPALPTFVTVNVCGTLLVFVCHAPKARVLGETVYGKSPYA